MELFTVVLALASCFNAVGGFLVQPSQPTTLNDQSLRLLTKSLLTLSNYAAVVGEICRAYPDLALPHPEECQLYYNCSPGGPHMMECDYPYLFSEETHRCENFTEVCCGARKELKDRCSYRKEKPVWRYTCDYLSCVGEPDGFVRAYVQARYKICLKERVVQEGSCKLWFELPYHGKCTSRLEIPISSEGHLPSCSGMPDGIYRFNESSAQITQTYYHDVHSRLGYTNYGDFYGIGRLCDAYYKCSGGAITVVKCENGTVFHADVGACKPGNSSVPNNCQLYCNPEKTDVHPFPLNVAECPYPLQFSETTRRCENFTKVVCGERKEEKYICHYLNECFYERPCEICHLSQPPNCIVLPDGVFHYPNSAGEYFIRCYGNRLVEKGKCPIDQEWGTQTYPYNGTCTQRYAIPTSVASYGRLPNCTAKSDGNYQFRTRPCDAYYRCEGGNATAVKCPEHTYFDATRKQCSSNVACYRA